MSWFVYIIRCSDNSLYTGITTDIKRRFSEHKQCGAKNYKGAKYFYAHTPVEIVYTESYDNRSDASKREYAIKRLTATKKWQLIH